MAEGEPVFRTQREREFRKFDQLGEDEVRRLMATGRYGGARLVLVQEWLSRFDAEREAERLKEEISLANRATLAAEAAVEEARIANSEARAARREAQRANIIAVIALAATAIMVIVDILKPR